MNCSLIFKSKRHLFFLFFSLTIKDKTKISLTIKILHLGQGSFTRKVRTIFTLKIIVSIFVKLFLVLVLHLRQFFIVRIFVKRATVYFCYYYTSKAMHATVTLRYPRYVHSWFPCNTVFMTNESNFSHIGCHNFYTLLGDRLRRVKSYCLCSLILKDVLIVARMLDDKPGRIDLSAIVHLYTAYMNAYSICIAKNVEWKLGF